MKKVTPRPSPLVSCVPGMGNPIEEIKKATLRPVPSNLRPEWIGTHRPSYFNITGRRYKENYSYLWKRGQKNDARTSTCLRPDQTNNRCSSECVEDKLELFEDSNENCLLSQGPSLYTYKELRSKI